jgi:hypothetical protein
MGPSYGESRNKCPYRVVLTDGKYVYSSEIMPLQYRHVGFALSVSCQWLAAFLTVYAGPIAIADPNVTWKTWIWFLVFNAIAIPYGKTYIRHLYLFPPDIFLYYSGLNAV